MRSHFVRGEPTATPERVKRLFEELLPAEDNVFVRRLRLSELPAGAESGRRYYGAFDGDGVMRKCDHRKQRLLDLLAQYEIAVHVVH